MLACMFMGGTISSHGVIVDADMVPFLKEALRDKDPKVREFARRNLTDVENVLKKHAVKTPMEKTKP